MLCVLVSPHADSRQDLAARLVAVAPGRDLVCPQLAPAAAAAAAAVPAAAADTSSGNSNDATAELGVAVPAGCPCNATALAARLRCAAEETDIESDSRIQF